MYKKIANNNRKRTIFLKKKGGKGQVTLVVLINIGF